MPKRWATALRRFWMLASLLPMMEAALCWSENTHTVCWMVDKSNRCVPRNSGNPLQVAALPSAHAEFRTRFRTAVARLAAETEYFGALFLSGQQREKDFLHDQDVLGAGSGLSSRLLGSNRTKAVSGVRFSNVSSTQEAREAAQSFELGFYLLFGRQFFNGDKFTGIGQPHLGGKQPYNQQHGKEFVFHGYCMGNTLAKRNGNTDVFT